MKTKVFEIIFDYKGSKIGEQELNPRSLSQHYIESEDKFVWIQYESKSFRRVLYNTQIDIR
jgi:hypothetical protein